MKRKIPAKLVQCKLETFAFGKITVCDVQRNQKNLPQKTEWIHLTSLCVCVCHVRGTHKMSKNSFNTRFHIVWLEIATNGIMMYWQHKLNAICIQQNMNIRLWLFNSDFMHVPCGNFLTRPTNFKHNLNSCLSISRTRDEIRDVQVMNEFRCASSFYITDFFCCYCVWFKFSFHILVSCFVDMKWSIDKSQHTFVAVVMVQICNIFCCWKWQESVECIRVNYNWKEKEKNWNHIKIDWRCTKSAQQNMLSTTRWTKKKTPKHISFAFVFNMLLFCFAYLFQINSHSYGDSHGKRGENSSSDADERKNKRERNTENL